MPFVEDLKKTVERVTGIERPTAKELAALTQPRKPQLMSFKSDGETPNNARCPMIFYRSPVKRRHAFNMAAVFEDLFKANGWTDSWRDRMYEFLHFHTRTHEVLGIARGAVRAEFGGAKGRTLNLIAGDVVILPAGTGHRALKATRDLLIVGAYPANGGTYDEPTPEDVTQREALAAIARVRMPRADPVYGREGPLRRVWGVVK